MLFRITRLYIYARQFKLPPQTPILNHLQGVPSSQCEKLGAHAKLIEMNFWGHHILTPSVVPIPYRGRIGEDLNVTQVIQILSKFVNIEQEIVEIVERVKRDAVLGY